jgi:hypothetical protein
MGGGWVDVEGSGHLADGPAFLDEGDGESFLIGS